MNTALSSPPIECHATPAEFFGMSTAHFLRDYWQKHPLLIRNAFPNFNSPISPDELAGLACEEGSLARLIVHQADNDSWEIQTGPFLESIFATLPSRDWTLLVQDVDKWDEGVAALLENFDFLPRWRIDDVMVSFAAPEGSVGAHVDQYDVFLIQGQGQRRWRIDAGPNPPQQFRDDVELRLLREFTHTHDWVLNPGDILYLPPGVPHHGVALDRCLTLSIGMRAPSYAEMLSDLADTLSETLSDHERYTDPDLKQDASDGRIDSDVLRRIRAGLQSIQQVSDLTLADWFADFITRYRSAGQIAAPPQPLSQSKVEKQLLAGAQLHLHPLARLAWHAQAGKASVHIDGERFSASTTLARQLGQRQPLDAPGYGSYDNDDRALVQHLVRQGILALSQH